MTTSTQRHPGERRDPGFNLICPIPLTDYPRVQLAHGGGGKLMNQLIDKMFLTAFDNPHSKSRHDSVVLNIPQSKLAFTTDSYVVNPLFFPGGNIGDLAVYGTVNDLAMSGARPLYLSLGFILEEGLKMDVLWQVVQAIAQAAKIANVQIVTGDTKVVDRGKGDGIYINSTGIGVVEHNQVISPHQIKSGDQIIVNGDLGRHGIAIMALREGLEFESTIESDTQPVADLVLSLLKAGIKISCLRDLTRGGLASALNEISTAAKKSIHVHESHVPVREDVKGACEILGFDPLYVANEGEFVAFVDKKDAQNALKIIKKHPFGKNASLIGEVTSQQGPGVTLKSRIGVDRILDMLSGEQLPRIC